MSTDFLAGAASRVITPALGERPIFLAGFQHNRRAIAVHSELYARALALRLDEQAFVLVVCDLIGLGRPDVEDVRAALAARGVADQFVGAIAPNAGAIRFYQSRGFRPAWLELTRF